MTVNAREAPAPVCRCPRRDLAGVPGPDDGVWADLPALQLAETAGGGRPRLATEVRVFRNGARNSLVVRFRGADEGETVSTFTGHDENLYEEDVLELFLGEAGDPTRYKEFEVSPANVKFDAAIFNDPQGGIAVDRSWHAPGWSTSVARLPDGFVSVWEIPFADLGRAAPRPGDRMRANFYRIDRCARHGDEYSAWSPTGAVEFHVPSAFGWLVFE